ncbi:hypothetical protein KBTX_02154 [wastewater metagenome]|uniref:YeeE/YedE family protein n=2 Tax=unclassified sequences TaxID=12908 RepID=A0A5B8RD09_9ZZZZ|nr:MULTISPECIES: DUF6691 family protein [Arhodomonas]MCS4505708.1 YeeE/YedE family protein [Arhodomonas aquaeolei]QEA05828.1 hypothetical protein KBTEX_02154 [uncultured organism]
MIHLVSIVAGLLFGAGLALAQMTDPARVLGFLDLTGRWDPTLVFVLAGAVATTLISFRFVLRRPRPVFAPAFQLPTRRDIDARLIGGAVVFGVGWGVAGFCPGPGIAALALGSVVPLTFVVGLAGGMILYRFTARP